MKLVLIIGDSAVGKMTVGQELTKITDLKLFHNHMAIELVMEVFGSYEPSTILRLRDVVFEDFARSDQYGLIFTYLWDFDDPSDWEYIRHVQEIFAPYGTEVYCVELTAPQEVRLKRNRTENRLRHKPSKRNLGESDARLLDYNRRCRCVSEEGEVPFAHYLRIDASEQSAEETARMIQYAFGLS